MTDYEIHPIAEIMPSMSPEALQELAADIKAHGLMEPITIFEGKILDGRCRYEACKIAGVELDPVRNFDIYDGEDALQLVLSANLHRRHLSLPERACVAAKVATLKPGSNQHATKGEGRSLDVSSEKALSQAACAKTLDGKQNTGQSSGLSISRAAKLLDVSPGSVQRVRTVLNSGDPKLIAAMEKGEIAMSKAAKIVREKPVPLFHAPELPPHSGPWKILARSQRQEALNLQAQGAEIPAIAAQLNATPEAIKAGIKSEKLSRGIQARIANLPTCLRVTCPDCREKIIHTKGKK